MKSSFLNNDCIYLLKDLTGKIEFTSFAEKEKSISNGVNYSEMITEEMPLSQSVIMIFKDMLERKAQDIASYTAKISKEIYKRGEKNAVIVSLARAGSPIGAIIKRYIQYKYNQDIPHYSISIIRGRGIDNNALDYIREHHPEGIMTFVDGWTGKGSITNELRKSISEYNKLNGTAISSDLAVLADPAKLSSIAGTELDVCIPNACLNSTISGLISRTILNKKYIGNSDFHGAVRYDNMAGSDMTNYFLDRIESEFPHVVPYCNELPGESNVERIIKKIKEDFPLADINKIKLSIGESSRALLRRIPYKILVKNPDNPDLSFIKYLANQKNIDIETYDTMNYECITLLK